MKPKNTICLWFDKDAQEAARFYSATFPDSEVTAVHEAPAEYPGGKRGSVLTVEFTVLGIPCLGLNGGPAFRHSEAFSFQIATDNQEETDRYWNAIVGNGHRKPVWLVQGSLGPLLADYPARANRCACGWWRRRQACFRGDDGDEENRHRRHRGCAPSLTHSVIVEVLNRQPLPFT
jgi:predicted 3-demethylubiquinone-9 3-methyltransferase (glyoxalase superfamily)